MAFKLGKNAGNLGVLAGGLAAMAGGPFSLLAAPALFKMFQDDQEEQQTDDERKYAANALMTGVMPKGVDPETGIDWNQGRPVDKEEQLGLAARAVPGEVMKARLAQMFPSPKDAKDRFLGTPGEGGVYDIENNQIVDGTRVAKPPEMGAMSRFTGPGGQVRTMNERSPEAQRLTASGQWNKEGSDGGASRIPFRIMTPQEKQAMGINDQRQYKTNGINFEPMNDSAPAGYRNTPEGNQEAIPGGPADIGQKGLPQAYKDASAGLNTLEAALNAFSDTFEGRPAKVDPVTGAVIEPAIPGTGTEVGGAGAGKLDTQHGAIVLGVKNAEQTGALDKGSVEFIENMVRKPTGWDSVLQRNSYTSAQLKEAKNYVKQKRADLDRAYQAGTWRPPGQGAPQGAPQPSQARQEQTSAVPPPGARQRGQKYTTPRGPMTWTGTGWVP